MRMVNFDTAAALVAASLAALACDAAPTRPSSDSGIGVASPSFKSAAACYGVAGHVDFVVVGFDPGPPVRVFFQDTYSGDIVGTSSVTLTITKTVGVQDQYTLDETLEVTGSVVPGLAGKTLALAGGGNQVVNPPAVVQINANQDVVDEAKGSLTYHGDNVDGLDYHGTICP